MAQPEYDYFARPAGGEGEGFGTSDARFGGSAPSAIAPGGLLGSAPAGRFGGPTGGPAQSSGTPAPAPAPAWTRSHRRGMPRWATRLIAGACALVVLGVVAAVAIPVLLDKRTRATYDATRMVLPSAVVGMKRNSAIKVAPIARQLQLDVDQAMPGTFDVTGAGYGSAGAGAAAIVVTAHAKRALSSADQATLRLGLIAQTSKEGEQVTAETPGRLGGTLDCITRVASTTCIATDAAGMTTITLGHIDVRTRVDIVRRIREATELRG